MPRKAITPTTAEVRQVLADLMEWESTTGGWFAPCWQRARRMLRRIERAPAWHPLPAPPAPREIEPKGCLRAWLVTKALTQTDLLNALHELNDGATDDEISRAKEEYAYASSDNIEVDDNALTSRADDGVWVQGWVYLANEDAGDADGELVDSCAVCSVDQPIEDQYPQHVGDRGTIGPEDRLTLTRPPEHVAAGAATDADYGITPETRAAINAALATRSKGV